MMVAAAAYLLLSFGIDDGLPAQGDQGICLPSPELWPLPRWADTVGGLALNGLMLLIMAMLNKSFNVLRSNTWLQLGLFAVIAAAVPRLAVNVNTGIMLAVAVNASTFLMFSCFDNPWRSRRVFLSFLLLSALASIDYCYVVYIPVMWIMAAQMKIFNWRTFLSSVFGIATPWIILFGFGIISPQDFHLPEVVSIFRAYADDSVLYLLAISAFTAFMLVNAIAMNLSRTIAYNARARAFNGALTLVGMITIAAIAINYNNLLAYLPLLNVCAAYQITHWLVNHRFDRQYIAVMVICALYFAFYVWRLFL